MIKRLLLISLIVLLFGSCASYYVSRDIKKIELDMTKEEIIAIMGKSYSPVSLDRTENGTILETIKYSAQVSYYYYFLHFENGKLVRWNEEYMPPYRVPVAAPAPTPAQ